MGIDYDVITVISYVNCVDRDVIVAIPEEPQKKKGQKGKRKKDKKEKRPGHTPPTHSHNSPRERPVVGGSLNLHFAREKRGEKGGYCAHGHACVLRGCREGR